MMEETITFQLTLVRHGEAESNLKGGCTHGATESPLTELGRQQAQKVAARLKDEKFDMVYSSDLSRAYDTCLAIVGGDPKVIVKDELLRERGFGRFEGQPNSVLTAVIDEAKKEGMSWSEAFYNLKDDTMEKEEDMEKRLTTVLDKVIGKVVEGGRDGTSVLIAAHGLVNRAYVLYFIRNFKNDLPLLSEIQYQHSPNTGVTRVNLVVDKLTGRIKEVRKVLLYCGSHLDADYKGSFHEKK